MFVGVAVKVNVAGDMVETSILGTWKVIVVVTMETTSVDPRFISTSSGAI